jgi:hypothetical protein
MLRIAGPSLSLRERCDVYIAALHLSQREREGSDREAVGKVRGYGAVGLSQ